MKIPINSLENKLRELKNRAGIASLLVEAGAKKICEVGVNRGKNFRVLLDSDPALAVAVDLWQADAIPSQNDQHNTIDEMESFYQYICSLKKDFPCIEARRMFSAEAAKLYPDKYFDYVYIDADHSEKAVKGDIMAWYPKVCSGGIIGGHDFKFKRNCGVKQAVYSFIKEMNFAEDKLIFTPERCPSWFIVKP